MLFHQLLCALFALFASVSSLPYFFSRKETIVTLFQWKWADVAHECENFLQHYGYTAVEISPPNEHVVMTSPNNPWWQRYMSVSYSLDSQGGSQLELMDMVARCNAVGVKIFANVNVNHMARLDMAGTGINGCSFNGGKQSYPCVPFNAQNFNNGKCTSADGLVHLDSSTLQTRVCQLFQGAADLDQSQPTVQSKLTDYLNSMIDIGISGFKISFAENMDPDDLHHLFHTLNFLNTDWFKPLVSPYIYQDVNGSNYDVINPTAYFDSGSIINYNYTNLIISAVKRAGVNFHDFAKLGNNLGLTNSAKSVILIDDQWKQRHANSLSFKSREEHIMATSFMLAWRFGVPKVMSSFNFDTFDQHAPFTGANTIASPSFDENGQCINGWVCEHRWSEIKNMVDFNARVVNSEVSDVVTDDNRIAFSRYGYGFYMLNNDPTKSWSQTFQTRLASGTYCDIISGILQTGSCTGKSVDVHVDGTALITLEAGKSLAIYIDSNVDCTDCTVPTPPSTIPTQEASTAGLETTPVAQPTETTRMAPETTEMLTTQAPVKTTAKISTTESPVDTTTKRITTLMPTTLLTTKKIGDWQRTVIFIHKETHAGQDLFVRGGIDYARIPGCTDDADSDPCSIKIQHQTTVPDSFTTYLDWRVGDDHLDWYGAEDGQGKHDGIDAEGTPLAWSTNDPNTLGYQALNHYGPHYWIVDLMMDCSGAYMGMYFEAKAYLRGGDGWESNVGSSGCVDGTAAFSAPFSSTNHIGLCGKINVFDFDNARCTAENF